VDQQVLVLYDDKYQALFEQLPTLNVDKLHMYIFPYRKEVGARWAFLPMPSRVRIPPGGQDTGSRVKPDKAPLCCCLLLLLLSVRGDVYMVQWASKV